MMDKKVFIYWDDSNIFVSAQEAAVEREGEAVRFRVRIHFRNLLELAHARRDVEHATAVGSIHAEDADYIVVCQVCMIYAC